MKLLSRLNSGVSVVSQQIETYTTWWDAQNQSAATNAGPLLVAIGDSTSVGIGASAPDRGFVGQVRDGLSSVGDSWRVINLAVSGARVDDALDRQLPILADLGVRPDQVICCIGTNDVVWTAAVTSLREDLRLIASQLPAGSVVCGVAGASGRARLANRALRGAAAEHDLRYVNPWTEPGATARERLSVDRFHPNDLGYALMARPICRALGIPEPDL